MEIDKNCTSTASVETSDQYINVNNKTDQKENNAAIRLPRKEFRKLMKKQRKKNARIEAAKAKQQGQEEEEETPEEVMETIKAEEKKRFDILNTINIIIFLFYFKILKTKKEMLRGYYGKFENDKSIKLMQKKRKNKRKMRG